MTTLYYRNVSQAQIDKMKPELIKGGAKITETTSNVFSIAGHGGLFVATYAPKSLALTVVIQKQPHFCGIQIPDSEVDSRLKAALAA
jgi:hypothetical protein